MFDRNLEAEWRWPPPKIWHSSERIWKHLMAHVYMSRRRSKCKSKMIKQLSFLRICLTQMPSSSKDWQRRKFSRQKTWCPRSYLNSTFCNSKIHLLWLRKQLAKGEVVYSNRIPITITWQIFWLIQTKLSTWNMTTSEETKHLWIWKSKVCSVAVSKHMIMELPLRQKRFSAAATKLTRTSVSVRKRKNM